MHVRQLLMAHLGHLLVVGALVAGAFYMYDEANVDGSRGMMIAAAVVAGLSPATGVIALAAMVIYAAALEYEGKSGGLAGDRVRFMATWGLLPLAGTMLLTTPMALGYMRRCVPGGEVVSRVAKAAKPKKSGKKGKKRGGFELQF